MPILTWLQAYDRSFLRFDVIAGATVWGLLVPESIAYAGLAGLPPEAGLYTLLATLAAYAIFGTSRHLVAGATSAAAVLIASGVAEIDPAGAAEYAAAGAAIVLFCGSLFLLAGILRLGFVAQFLSLPVMAGFVFGLAIFVTVKQLPKLFGIEGGTGDMIRQFVHLLTHLDETSGATLAVGVGALALLFGLLIVITVLFLTPLFKNLPEAVLAALIIFAVSHLWKIREFKGYLRVSRVEFWLGIATLAGVITFDVLPGLLIGVVAMLILFIYHASTPHVVTLGRIPGVAGGYGNVKRHPDYALVPDLLVLRLEAPVFYANATGVRDRIKKLVGAADPLPRAVILDAGVNDSLDITSAAMLEGLVKEVRSAGIDFALAEVRHSATDMARRSRLVELLGKDRIFDTVEEAVTTLEKPAASPARDHGGPSVPSTLP